MKNFKTYQKVVIFGWIFLFMAGIFLRDKFYEMAITAFFIVERYFTYSRQNRIEREKESKEETVSDSLHTES